MEIPYDKAKEIIRKFQTRGMLFEPQHALKLYMSLYEDATTLNKQPIFIEGRLNPVVQSMVVPVALELYDQIVMVYEQGPDGSELHISSSPLEDTLKHESPDNISYQPHLFNLHKIPYDETSYLTPRGKRRRK